MTRNAGRTRQDILEAATILVDVEGVRDATVELIARTAGVTKRTLYNYFRSKDDLLAECLARNSAEGRAQLLHLKSASSTTEALIESLFSDIFRSARNTRWKGCSYVRAAFELAGFPGHPVVKAAREHKSKIEAILISSLSSAGALDPESYARRLVLLYEGAISLSVLYRDLAYATEARELAQQLVRQALRWPTAGQHAPSSNTEFAVKASEASVELCSLARRNL